MILVPQAHLVQQVLQVQVQQVPQVIKDPLVHRLLVPQVLKVSQDHLGVLKDPLAAQVPQDPPDPQGYEDPQVLVQLVSQDPAALQV